MVPNANKMWDLQPHTEAKHAILRSYLGGWFPVMAKFNPRILYVDGFAGPGEYSGGQPGSPIIALQVAANHYLRDRIPKGEVVFFFIEKDLARFQNMNQKVQNEKWPGNFRIHPVHGSFAEVFDEVLARLEERGRPLAPAFVFVDPFGPEGFPMELLHRLLQNPQCELLINLDYNDLNRWYLNDVSQHNACSNLFGTNAWHECVRLPTKNREHALIQLYQERLKDAASYILPPFRMVNKHNQTQYYLFFGTHHPLGLRIMKEAMWKVDPTGSFTFSDMSNPYQPRLLDKALSEILVSEIAEELTSAFKGQKVSKATLEEWADVHPRCKQTHLTRALRTLEENGLIAIDDPENKRRPFKYPERVEVSFLT